MHCWRDKNILTIDSWIGWRAERSLGPSADERKNYELVYELVPVSINFRNSSKFSVFLG
jgi:hypothetical protein